MFEVVLKSSEAFWNDVDYFKTTKIFFLISYLSIREIGVVPVQVKDKVLAHSMQKHIHLILRKAWQATVDGSWENQT